MGTTRFDGRTVLVTGGGRGTGAVIARMFAEAGAHVVVNYFHSAEPAQALEARLRAAGHRVDAVRASVADPRAVDAMFADLHALGVRPDVLVNNAASGKLLPLAELDDTHWQRGFDTNVRGALWCARRAAETMAPGSAIVNVSSIGSTIPFADYASIGVTKAALESLTRYLAMELAPRGIRVNAASAALLDTPEADVFPETVRDTVLRSTPLGRLATAEELAELVLFLASGAASFVTGQVLLADGGLSLGTALIHPLPRAAEPEPTDVLDTADVADVADDEIVLVGQGVVAPGVSDPAQLWRALSNREDHFSEARPDRFPVDSFCTRRSDQDEADRSYARTSGYVVDPLLHKAIEHPEDYERSALWLRHCLLQALDTVHTGPADRAMFAVGYGADGNQEVEEALAAHTFLAGLASDTARATVRARFDEAIRRGTGVLPHEVLRTAARGLLPADTEYAVTDGACSSALYALDLAVKALRDGDCDIAFAGGAFAFGPRNLVLFAKLTGLSPSGRANCLDRSADGVVFADGAGVLALKRAGRARADGDTILGVVDSIGLSCDGKGKAIYAPNEVGQILALHRAYDGVADLADVPLHGVIGHLTGTRAGDSTEVVALGKALGSGPAIPIVANKAQIGHTGWAAGAVAVVGALQAFRHRELPRQYFGEGPIPQLDGTRLVPPTEPVRLGAEGDTLRLGISAFGFGGTNAHLVLRKPGRTAARSRVTPRLDTDVVLVGWGSDVPDGDVRQWLLGVGAPPARSFGEDGPATDGIILPASVLQLMDRCQVMMLRAHRGLAPDVLAACAVDRERTGVVAGHMGPTTAASRYAARCYLSELNRVLDGGDPGLDALDERVRAAIPVASDDSFPGIMANVIAARLAAVANYRGLNLTVDDGRDSGAVALRTAERYLRHGNLDFAVVAALNGNTTPEYAAILGDPVDTLAEGAFLAVLCTSATAARHGLRPLATVTTTRMAQTRPPQEGQDYLGANGMVDLLRHVVHGRTGVVAPSYPGGVGVHVTGTAAPPTGFRRLRIGWRPERGPAPPDVPPTGLVVTREHVPPLPLPDDVDDVWVLVDATETDLADSLALHDAVFELGRALAVRGRGTLGCLVRGGIQAGARHPVAGLFAGMVKSLSRTAPDVHWHVVLTDRRPLADGVALLVAEAAEAFAPVVVAHDGGTRLVPDLIDAPFPPIVATPADLVVVAAGGARGITAECLVRLADAVTGTIHLLGRAEPATDPVPPRPVYLREQAAARPGVGVRVLAGEYDRLLAAAAVAETVRRIERPGVRVVHHTCDLTDAPAVRSVVDRIVERHGRVDLVVNSAAQYRPGSLRAKSIEDFRAVRDTKVDAYLNLRAAFAGREPAHWVNFGSWLGIDGWPDEPDYCAGNDMLAAAAESRRANGYRESTIAWPLWSDTGNFADPLNGDVLADRGGMERVDTALGTRLFVAEVLCPDTGTAGVTYETGETPTNPAGARNQAWAPILRPYLRGHRFNGEPVLSASVTYLAAARSRGWSDLDTRPPAMLDRRLLLPMTFDTRYTVRTDPDGYTTIATDVVYASMRLAPPGDPVPSPTPAGDLVPADVALYSGADVLHLDGAFRTLADVRCDDDVVTARLTLAAAPTHGVGRLACAIDAVVQMALLTARRARPGMLVPVGIDSLAVHSPWPRWADRPVTVTGHVHEGRVVASAATADGEIVVQLLGMHTTPARLRTA